jgi:uncharacterized protein (TIGR02680 family)
MRRLRAAETERAAAAQALTDLAARVEALTLDERGAATTVETLLASPQMRDADALDRARRNAGERARDATDAEAALARARESLSRLERVRDEAEAAAATSRTELTAAATAAEERAGGAGLGAGHRASAGPLGLPDGMPDQAFVDGARRRLEQSVTERLRAVEHVQRLVTAVDAAAMDLSIAKGSYTDLTAQLDEAIGAEREAHDTLDGRQQELARGYRAWFDSLTELAAEDPDSVADALAEWYRMASGPSPVSTAVRDALDAATTHVMRLRVEIEQRRAGATENLDQLRAERARLTDGQHLPPPPPHTRDESERAGRAGAPLWLLCDFQPAVDDTARARLEAALEASGLLDAWVTPDGTLLPSGVHDTVVVPGTSPEPEAGAHLGTWLVPAIDRDDPRTAEMSDAVVAAVLRHVGARAGDGHVWVDIDGRWQIGPLHGAWGKPAAAHIGQSARASARRRRLAELVAEIAGAEGELARIDADAETVARRDEVARREAAAAPADEPVRAALADTVTAARAVAALRGRVIEAETRVAERRRALDSAVKARDEAAADLGIAVWVADLRGLERAIGEYRQTLAGLWPTIRSHGVACAQAARTAQDVAEAATTEARHATLLLDARKRAYAAAAERDTLERSVGAAAEEILRRLAGARNAHADVQRGLDEAKQHREDTRIREAVAQVQVDAEHRTLDEDAGRRDSAIAALRALAASKLLDIAHSGVEADDSAGWSVTRAVEVARSVDAALADVDGDDGAWQRVQKDIHVNVQRLAETLLPYGYQPAMTVEDGLFVVTVPFRGRECTMNELRDALREEVTTRQLLLDAREREILENHLIGEVSAHLHDRLRAAEALVREMNEELRTRRTSTGMTLRFVWEPLDDGPPGLLEARTRLLRTGATWSPAERQALGAFLQERVRAVRTANDTGTWQEHMAIAFDYRAWHQFCVERQQDGVWRRLTRRTHGTGSGGEKAIALTIPQFAAAAAHYRTADLLAPRLILLDEAFVGIDKSMRAQCMGLLRAFDLDFVMTSEQEWGCYATLPGVAIYHLSTRPGIDAVGITRWIWNGCERALDASAVPGARAPGPAGGDGDGLAP